MTPDQHIIRSLQQGNKDAVAQLYDQYGAALYGVVLRIVKSEDIAEDVMQEAFVKIWKNGFRYDPAKGTIFTWMLNIARRKAIDKTREVAYRHNGRTQGLDDSLSLISHQPPPEHIGLRHIVDNLDEKYRTIIDLAYFQGYTQTEIVEHLDVPLGTVKSRIRIGLRELRKIFEEYKVSLLILSANLAAGALMI